MPRLRVDFVRLAANIVVALVLGSAAIFSAACSDEKGLVIAEVTVQTPISGTRQVTVTVTTSAGTQITRTFTADKDLSASMPARLGVRVDSSVSGSVTVTATAVAGEICYRAEMTASLGAGQTVSVALVLAPGTCAEGTGGGGGNGGSSGQDGGSDVDAIAATGGAPGGTGGAAGAGGSGGVTPTGGTGTPTGGVTGTGGAVGTGGGAPASDGGVDRSDDGGLPDAPLEVAPPSNPPSLSTCLEYDHGALICNPATGVGNWALWSVAFSPDGRSLLSAGEDNRIKFWRVEGKTLLAEGRILSVRGTTPNHIRLAYSPDGKYLAAGNNTGDVRIFDTATWIVHADLPVGHTTRVEGVQFSPDSTKLLSIGADGLRIWSVATKSLLSAHALAGEPLSLAVSQVPGQTLWVAAGMDNGQVAVLDANAAPPVVRNFVVTASASDRGISAVAFSPDGQILAAGADEGALWMFNAADKTMLTKTGMPLVNNEFQDVNAVAFFPGGRHVGAAIWGFGTAGQIGVWDTVTRSQRSMLGGTRGPVSIAVSPDGAGVAVGNWGCAKVTYCRD